RASRSPRRTPGPASPSAGARRRGPRRDRGRAQLWELHTEIGRVDLEQSFGFGQAGERVAAQDPQHDAGRLIPLERVARRGGKEDLSAVASGAHAGGGIDRDADVSGLTQRRAAGVDADADADLDIFGPLAFLQRSLDIHRGVERACRLTEGGEEFIRARVDLVSACCADALANERSYIAQERRISITEPAKQAGGPLDVGEQECHRAARQARDVPSARRGLRLLPFFTQLPVEEPYRDDAVLLRGPKEPLPSALARDIVLERGLVESRERIAHMRRVVDRQAPTLL